MGHRYVVISQDCKENVACLKVGISAQVQVAAVIAVGADDVVQHIRQAGFLQLNTNQLQLLLQTGPLYHLRTQPVQRKLSTRNNVSGFTLQMKLQHCMQPLVKQQRVNTLNNFRLTL